MLAPRISMQYGRPGPGNEGSLRAALATDDADAALAAFAAIARDAPALSLRNHGVEEGLVRHFSTASDPRAIEDAYGAVLGAADAGVRLYDALDGAHRAMQRHVWWRSEEPRDRLLAFEGPYVDARLERVNDEVSDEGLNTLLVDPNGAVRSQALSHPRAPRQENFQEALATRVQEYRDSPVLMGAIDDPVHRDAIREQERPDPAAEILLTERWGPRGSD